MARAEQTIRAVIYTRLSLDRAGSGLAVARQEEECRKLCEREGWEVLRVYTDNDLSATSGKRRPGFEQLLADRDYDKVLVWHTDRIARVPKDLERLIDLGVDIQAVTAGGLDLSNPSGRAVARTLVAWASYEGEQKALRQTAALAQKARSGKPLWGRRVFGLELDGTERTEEGDALRAGAEMLLAGHTLHHVARTWNQQGIRTAAGKEWVAQTVRQTMLTPRIAGLAVHKGEIVGEGNWDACVDPDTWHRLRRHLTNPSRNTGGPGRPPTTLLSAIATCGACGSGMATVRHVANRKDGRKVRSYRCRACGQCMTRQPWADGVVVRLMWEFLPMFREVWPTEREVAETEVGQLQHEVDLLEQRRIGLSEDYAAGLIDREQMQAGTKWVRAELEKKKSELAKLELPSDDWAWLPTDEESFSKVFDSMTLPKRRELVQKVFDKIVMHNRGRTRWIPGVIEFVPHGFGSVASARSELERLCPEVVAQRRADHAAYLELMGKPTELMVVPVDPETNLTAWPKGQDAWKGLDGDEDEDEGADEG